MLAAEAARQNSCVQVATHHVMSVKTFTQELKAFTEDTHVSAVPGEVFHWCAHDGGLSKGLNTTMVKHLAHKEHSAFSLTARLPCLCCHEMLSGYW